MLSFAYYVQMRAYYVLMLLLFAWLSKEGLTSLVEYNEKVMFEVKLKEIKSTLTTMINEEAEISEVTETVKQQVKDAKFPDIDVIRMLWDVLMEAIQWSRKNQQQNSNSALRQVISLSRLHLQLSLEFWHLHGHFSCILEL